MTLDELILLNGIIIEVTGGVKGVLNRNNLEIVVARVQAGFENYNLFPTIFLKAAAYAESIATLHPFVDGNKRTAYAAAGVFLALNGYYLRESDEAEQVMVNLTEGRITLGAFAEWLKRNVKQS